MTQSNQKNRAGIALAAMIIGISIVFLWYGMLYLATEVGTPAFKYLFLVIPTFVEITGLVLGVIGLICGIKKSTRSAKGIVFASIGIVLNLAFTAATCYMLWSTLQAGAMELFS